MIKKLLKRSVLLVILTLLTQLGGFFYLLASILWKLVIRKNEIPYQKWIKPVFYIGVYLSLAFTIAPLIASIQDRKALPYKAEGIKSANILQFVMLRNYVRKQDYVSIGQIALELNKQDICLIYLDAGFPLVLGKFPMLPHLSHGQGRQVDFSFAYRDSETQVYQPDAIPNFMGYGISETPSHQNTTVTQCENKNPFYSALTHVTVRWDKSLEVDPAIMKEVLNEFTSKTTVKRIFLEPYLKERWKINNEKIRFHGCGAVRHDDHFHVEFY